MTTEMIAAAKQQTQECEENLATTLEVIVHLKGLLYECAHFLDSYGSYADKDAFELYNKIADIIPEVNEYEGDEE